MKPLFCMLIHKFVTHWWCCIELKHFSESKHLCSANSGYCLIFPIILSLYHWLFCHSTEGCCFQPCCCLLGNRPVFYQVLLHMLGRSVFCFPCHARRDHPQHTYMVEEVLQLLIGQVYAELFETIHCKVFKPKNIQDT